MRSKYVNLSAARELGGDGRRVLSGEMEVCTLLPGNWAGSGAGYKEC